MASVKVEPHCGFADPKLMTCLTVCDLVAEYYITHHEWPLTKAQLQEQLAKMLEAERAHKPADQLLDSSEFFGRFNLLDLNKNGEDLTMSVRFTVEHATTGLKVTFTPAPTADEILVNAMANGKKL